MYNVKHRYAICFKFGDKFLGSSQSIQCITNLVLEATANLLLYYREFQAFVVIVVIQHIFVTRPVTQRNTLVALKLSQQHFKQALKWCSFHLKYKISLYRPAFEQQYIQNGKGKHCLYRMFFKEYKLNCLVACRLIVFALVVLKSLMFKVCGIIGLPKIEFFNFSGTERIKNCKKREHFIASLMLISVHVESSYF